MRLTNIACLSLFLLGSAAASARAQAEEPVAAAEESAEPWTLGVAPRVGFTIPTSELGPMAVGGLEIDYALPVLDGQLVIALDGTLTQPSEGGSVNDDRIGGEGGYDIEVTEFKVGLDAVYRIFGPDSILVPFVGAGPVLHMLKTEETTSFAPGTNEAQDTEVGFELLGGADLRLGPGYALAEARVVYSNLDHLFTGDTNAGNVMLSAGYRLVF